MTDTVADKRIKLARLARNLKKGDKRELAKRMDVYPGRISDALDGFVRKEQFLDDLAVEIQKLLAERA